MNKDDNQGQANAKAWMDTIREMVANLNSNDNLISEDAREAITESALSVEIRSGWHTLDQKAEPGEYKILLTTGGPALQIKGELNKYAEPETASLEYKNWFTEWTEQNLSSKDAEILLTFATQFYFDTNL